MRNSFERLKKSVFHVPFIKRAPEVVSFMVLEKVMFETIVKTQVLFWVRKIKIRTGTKTKSWSVCGRNRKHNKGRCGREAKFVSEANTCHAKER